MIKQNKLSLCPQLPAGIGGARPGLSRGGGCIRQWSGIYPELGAAVRCQAEGVFPDPIGDEKPLKALEYVSGFKQSRV